MTPVRHLLWLHHPRNSWKKSFAMLQAYFDESGIHEGTRYCFIAGYVGSLREWDKFIKLWDPYAHDPEFHAKSFFARDPNGKRVKPYNDWSDNKADAYLDRLLHAITSVRIYPIGAMVDVPAFRQYSHEERAHLTGSNKVIGKQTISGAPTKPFFLAFQGALTIAFRRLKRSDWKVHFMFDEQKNFAPLALRMYQYFKQIDPEWNPRMGDIAFGSRKNHIALQAADLLAYSWYQIVLNGRQVSPDIFKALCALTRKEDELMLFTKAFMDKLLSKAPPTRGRTYTVR